ncbi:iron-containing alcohol dehydrogenase [Actinoplanes sichuanensis]|uniref:Iron-containing alcohol dehydrogenase n=1 Tax=Actinoplanes sichuanensis TaxID=512349 RepID=A0ABW4ARN2_9ACTN|nr:iron-containing alcohol dehydrogenase [Actinoplanes sichuanensis]
MDDLDHIGLERSDVIVTSPRAWQTVSSRFPKDVRLLDADGLAVHGASRIVAVGAGRTMDRAKILAADSGLPLITIPTVLATDAAFSSVAAFRDRGFVEYRETGLPEAVVIDSKVLAQAPLAWHRWGLGDLISVVSALSDRRTITGVDPYVEEAAAVLVGDTLKWAGEATDDLVALADLLVRKVELGLAVDAAWLEEGTEHYLAYLLETKINKSLWHGELILALMPVCAAVQQWPASQVATVSDALRACGAVRPARCLLTSAAFVDMVNSMPEYCREHGYDNTVLRDDRVLDEIRTEAIRAWETGW